MFRDQQQVSRTALLSRSGKPFFPSGQLGSFLCNWHRANTCTCTTNSHTLYLSNVYIFKNTQTLLPYTPSLLKAGTTQITTVWFFIKCMYLTLALVTYSLCIYESLRQFSTQNEQKCHAFVLIFRNSQVLS